MKNRFICLNYLFWSNGYLCRWFSSNSIFKWVREKIIGHKGEKKLLDCKLTFHDSIDLSYATLMQCQYFLFLGRVNFWLGFSRAVLFFLKRSFHGSIVIARKVLSCFFLKFKNKKLTQPVPLTKVFSEMDTSFRTFVSRFDKTWRYLEMFSQFFV